MRLFTTAMLAICLSSAAFAGNGFIVKLRCSGFSEQDLAEHGNIICIQEQCYIVVDTEEDAEFLVKTGLASGYEPNVLRRPLIEPTEESNKDQAEEEPEKMIEESKCAY